MKRFFNKIKTGLVTFWLALISFPSKVKGLYDWGWKKPQRQSDYWILYPSEEELYWVPSSIEPSETIVDKIIKIAPRLLIVITFIVWIVSFLKIRKIDDEAVKKKKIKKTVIIIAILILLLITSFIISAYILTK